MKNKVVIKQISELKENTYNPNVMPEKKYQSLIENIKRFGFLQPVLISNDNTIIDGAHRTRAAKECGLKSLPCVVFDNIDEAKEYDKLLTLSMNNLRGENNEDRFNELIKDISSKFEIEDISLLTGFDLKMIEKLNNKNEDRIFNFNTEFEVIIDCITEIEQENIYNKLTKDGYKCRILAL